MNKPHLVAILLWILGISDGVRQGLALPSQTPAQEGFGTFGAITLVLPIVFFAVAPLWMKGHPFDLKTARDWINAKHGQGTYESYTRAIKPLALFAAVAASIGLVGLYSSLRAGAPGGAYATAGFFISSAFGFAFCRYILKLRGNGIE